MNRKRTVSLHLTFGSTAFAIASLFLTTIALAQQPQVLPTRISAALGEHPIKRLHESQKYEAGTDFAITQSRGTPEFLKTTL